jgi:hypothetical protein
LFAVALVLADHAPVLAMPTFGQAYGVDCSLCHTAVPALNAYGRNVQRSQYAILDESVLKKSFPVWLGEQANYDSQAPDPDTHRIILGNAAVHVAGLIDDNWSYHVQEWLVSDNGPGFADTAWVSYNNLFAHNGYIEVGKLEVPAPSPYSQWFEIAPYATPEVTVGEHAYQLDANRWGGKVGYTRANFNVAAAYVGSDGDWSDAGTWVPPNGKALQYQAAIMQPKGPLEAGVYGAVGTYPISDGLTDQYHAYAGYVQRDPKYGMPGVFAVYQTTSDSYPFAGAGGTANGSDYTIDVYEPVMKGDLVFGFRREMTNDGLGNVSNTGEIDMTVRVAKYLHLYTEVGLSGMNPGNGANIVGTPAWRAFLWWTTPVTAVQH